MNNTNNDAQQALFVQFHDAVVREDKESAKAALKEIFLLPLTSEEKGQVYFSLMTQYLGEVSDVESAYEKTLDAIIGKLRLLKNREQEIGDEMGKAAARSTIADIDA